MKLEFNNYNEFFHYCANTYLMGQLDETESVIMEMHKFIQENNTLEYAPISIFVFNNDEEVEIVQLNLRVILEHSLIHTDGYDKVLAAILKVSDHINLAISQKRLVEEVVLRKTLAQIEQLSQDIEVLAENTATSMKDVENFKSGFIKTKNEVANLKSSLKDSKELSEKISNTFDQLKLDKTKIYTDFVGILGIFATIIFAAFGGLNLLTGIFENLKDVRVGKLFIFSSLIIGAIISMLFILLNGIAKLTGLNLKSCKCAELNESCSHTWAQQHPSIVIISYLIAFIFLEGTMLYLVEYKEIIKIFNDLHVGLQSFLMLIVLPLLFVLLFWFKIIKPNRSESKNERST